MTRTPSSALALAILAATGPVAAQDRHPAFNAAPYAAEWSDARKIESALSAMPGFMREDAAVWDWQPDADGNLAVLREGDGDWTCFPDRPQTPSNDPMCHDPVFLEWMLVNATGRTPRIEAAGLSYMLQGGSAFTQDSPFVTGPLDGDEWYYMGPHVMVVLTDASDWSAVSRDTSMGRPVVEALALDHPILLFPVAAPDETVRANAIAD